MGATDLRPHSEPSIDRARAASPNRRISRTRDPRSRRMRRVPGLTECDLGPGLQAGWGQRSATSARTRALLGQFSVLPPWGEHPAGESRRRGMAFQRDAHAAPRSHVTVRPAACAPTARRPTASRANGRCSAPPAARAASSAQEFAKRCGAIRQTGPRSTRRNLSARDQIPCHAPASHNYGMGAPLANPAEVGWQFDRA